MTEEAFSRGIVAQFLLRSVESLGGCEAAGG